MSGRGSQGPLGPFYLGRGRFLCPLRPFSHALVFCFPPQVFLFFFGGPLGSRIRTGVPDAIRATRCIAHQQSTKTRHPPPSCFQFFVREGGNAVRFFFGAFSGECPLFFFRESFILLRLSYEQFFGGRTFGSKHFCLLFVLWCCIAYFLPSLFGFYLPKADRKFFFVLGARCTNNFGGELLVRGTSVCYLCCGAVFPTFCHHYFPKAVRKNSLYPGGADIRTIFGSELLVCYISVFLGCFGAVLPILCHRYLDFISRKLSEKFSSS